MLYRMALFTFAPTAIELVFVTALLAARFSPVTAALVAATFVVYVTWTLALTQVSTGRRAKGVAGGLVLKVALRNPPPRLSPTGSSRSGRAPCCRQHPPRAS